MSAEMQAALCRRAARGGVASPATPPWPRLVAGPLEPAHDDGYYEFFWAAFEEMTYSNAADPEDRLTRAHGVNIMTKLYDPWRALVKDDATAWTAMLSDPDAQASAAYLRTLQEDVVTRFFGSPPDAQLLARCFCACGGRRLKPDSYFDRKMDTPAQWFYWVSYAHYLLDGPEPHGPWPAIARALVAATCCEGTLALTTNGGCRFPVALGGATEDDFVKGALAIPDGHLTLMLRQCFRASQFP